MARLQDENHSILDHPAAVLRAAAEGWRRDDPSFVLSESEQARALRRFVEDPEGMDEDAQRKVTAWTGALKEDGAEFRCALREILGEEGFAGDASTLLEREAFAALLYDKVREVRETVESPDEIGELLRGAAVWAAYGGSIAYEFHLTTQTLSKRERKKLPGGPDLRQLIYLGVVNRFVARDPSLLLAARWVAELLPGEGTVEVLDSDDYLARIGFPFVENRVARARETADLVARKKNGVNRGAPRSALRVCSRSDVVRASGRPPA